MRADALLDRAFSSGNQAIARERGIRFGARFGLADLREAKFRGEGTENVARVRRRVESDYGTLLNREIRDWEIVDQVPVDSPLHFESEHTHLHLEKVFDANGDQLNVNLADPRVLAVFEDPHSTLYRFVRTHPVASISLHLGFSVERTRLNDEAGVASVHDYHDVPISPDLGRAETRRRLIRALTTLRSRLDSIGFDKEILLETLDYNRSSPGHGGRTASAYDYVTEPEFFAEVADETGCKVLFDCSHMFVSSRNIGYEHWLDYVDAFLRVIDVPEMLAEIHLSAPQQVGSRVYDRHRSLVAHADEKEVDAVLTTFRHLVAEKFSCTSASPLYVNLETPLENFEADLALVMQQTCGVLSTGSRSSDTRAPSFPGRGRARSAGEGVT